MRRVEALLIKLERHRDEPQEVDFQREIDNFSYEELRELAARMPENSGPSPLERADSSHAAQRVPQASARLHV
jgi:hypothetical protein